jgi:hypothetical protein
MYIMKEKFLRFGIIAMLSLIALSSNATLAQESDTTLLPRWRKTMLVEDLVKLEGLEVEVIQLKDLIADQKATIVERDTSINVLERTVSRTERLVDLRMLEGLAYQKEAQYWQSTARKYKRQRNRTFAGAVVVAVSTGLVYNYLLKR